MHSRNNSKKPPRFLERILGSLQGYLSNGSLGDFEEEYKILTVEKGKFKANCWYLSQVFLIYIEFLKLYSTKNTFMFGNYLKVAFRNLWQQKLYSSIMICGMAVGLALFVLAILFFDFNFSYDRFHQDADRIFTLVRTRADTDGNINHTMKVPTPVLPLIKDTFPEVEDVTRYIHESGRVISRNEKSIYEGRVWYADANFFTFFSFEWITGDRVSSLREPKSVVITQSTAQKYFANEDPIGQVLTINRNGQTELKVTGVIRDIVQNSSLQHDFVISSNTFEWLNSWDTESTTFLKLSNDVKASEFEQKLPGFIESRIPDMKKRQESFYLFPMINIHLYASHILNHFRSLMATPFYFVLGTGIAILLVVCINFINLSMARYMKRTKEVGLRKVIGASRFQLIKQFIGESVLLCLIALPLSLILYEGFRPAFQAYVGLSVDLIAWKEPQFFLFLLLITIFVGILSGCYPAIFLSSLKPVFIFKEHSSTGSKGRLLRKVLIVVQFTLSIILIIFTLIIHKQFRFLLEVDLGYSRENVIALTVNPDMMERLEPMKQELIQHPKIQSVGGANGFPFNWGHEEDITTKCMTEGTSIAMRTYHIDYGFIESLNMTLLKGRSFSKGFGDNEGFIISQMASQRLGWEDPIGKTMIVGNQKGTVVGMVKDFHFHNVFFKKGPALLYLKPNWTHLLYIKLSSTPNEDDFQFIRKQWDLFAKDLPYEAVMLDHRFEDDFQVMMKAFGTLQMITFVSILISCLGLFGLASFAAERRRKEFGIRKVLGASVPKIIGMFVTEFSFLVLISNFIAIPIGLVSLQYLNKNAWVDHPNFDWSLFLIAGFLALLAAIFSVIYQSVRAAGTNPVVSLKYE